MAKKQNRLEVVLHLDDSEESIEAKKLLDQAKVSYVLSDAILEITSMPPILCHGVGRYQGLDNIRAWLASELVN